MPALRPLIAADYQVWDDVETVTVFPPPQTASVRFEVSNVFRRVPTAKELAASGGVYLASDLVFYLPVAESKPATPREGLYPLRPGGIIRDANKIAWTILEAAPIALSTLWRCMTRNMVLAYNLVDSLRIIRPRITFTDGGEPVYSWREDHVTDVMTNIPCRVQKITTEVAVENDTEAARNNYSVILSEQVELQKDDRFYVTDGPHAGLVLKWLSLRNPERIDELPVVDCSEH